MEKKILGDAELTDKVAVVMGTRPGIIKMAPVYHALKAAGMDAVILHTGQHYSENMDKTFFDEMQLPAPYSRVEETMNHRTHGGQTAEMLRGIEASLLTLKPKVVLVCGDANTNLAAGLAARKLGLVVGHVEAGLRSHDWSMPEEHNRVILDHICELLFAPTQECMDNLVKDGVRGAAFLTGNTIVDATLEQAETAVARSDFLGAHGLHPGGYILLTSHREENVDHPERLASLLAGVERYAERSGLPVLFPMHPRTRKNIAGTALERYFGHERIHIVEPLSRIDFLATLKNAALVLTDSGGIQEEACILQVRCVTLRDNTERPETLAVGANVLAGVDSDRIVACAESMAAKPIGWPIPFGDGTASRQIAEVVGRVLSGALRPV